jgi:hypothetical protein
MFNSIAARASQAVYVELLDHISRVKAHAHSETTIGIDPFGQLAGTMQGAGAIAEEDQRHAIAARRKHEFTGIGGFGRSRAISDEILETSKDERLLFQGHF